MCWGDSPFSCIIIIITVIVIISIIIIGLHACRVRRALENTCLPLKEGSPDAVLTHGRGLLQVSEPYLSASVYICGSANPHYGSVSLCACAVWQAWSSSSPYTPCPASAALLSHRIGLTLLGSTANPKPARGFHLSPAVSLLCLLLCLVCMLETLPKRPCTRYSVTMP